MTWSLPFAFVLGIGGLFDLAATHSWRLRKMIVFRSARKNTPVLVAAFQQQPVESSNKAPGQEMPTKKLLDPWGALLLAHGRSSEHSLRAKLVESKRSPS